jgi:hypothetical protein
MKKIIMKCIIRSLGITFLLITTPALAIEEFSAGLATPSPTGLIFKLWTSRFTAFDFFAEWNFDSNDYNFHADYLTHNYELLDAKESNMIFYSGYGIRALDDTNDDERPTLGLRLPFGVTYLMEDPHIDLFGEVAPRMNVTPRTNFGLDIMVGVRYRIGTVH